MVQSTAGYDTQLLAGDHADQQWLCWLSPDATCVVSKSERNVAGGWVYARESQGLRMLDMSIDHSEARLRLCAFRIPQSAGRAMVHERCRGYRNESGI